MEESQETELEKVLKMTVEKQSRRMASLMLDLDLAHSQLEIMTAKIKEAEPESAQ